MTTPTPKTDKRAGYHGISFANQLITDPSGPYTHASFARELEREIVELRATLAAQTSAPPETLTLRDHYMLAVLPGILVAHSGDILADQLARAFEVVDMVLERRKGAPE